MVAVPRQLDKIKRDGVSKKKNKKNRNRIKQGRNGQKLFMVYGMNFFKKGQERTAGSVSQKGYTNYPKGKVILL